MRSLHWKAGKSGAPEKVFGSDYSKQLSQMEYEGGPATSERRAQSGAHNV